MVRLAPTVPAKFVAYSDCEPNRRQQRSGRKVVACCDKEIGSTDEKVAWHCELDGLSIVVKRHKTPRLSSLLICDPCCDDII
eukprot:2127773-Pleurochrysis_carterae.AAC.1